MIVLTLARKPLIGSVAVNVLKHGTGGINIDGSRLIFRTGEKSPSTERRAAAALSGKAGNQTPSMKAKQSKAIGKIIRRGTLETYLTGTAGEQKGRWPANLIFCHLPGCCCLGTVRVRANQSTSIGSGKGHTETEGHGIYHGVGGVVRSSTADADGLETVNKWDCQPGCPVFDLDQQSGPRKAGGVVRGTEPSRTGQNGIYGTWGRVANVNFEDEGGASRFFKQVHEPSEWFHASGDCLCSVCGKEYREHPRDYGQVDWEGIPFLRVLCNGSRMKL